MGCLKIDVRQGISSSWKCCVLFGVVAQNRRFHKRNNLFFNGNHSSFFVSDFTHQEDKAADGLVQHATCKVPAQSPTGSEPVTTSTLASLQNLLTEMPSITSK